VEKKSAELLAKISALDSIEDKIKNQLQIQEAKNAIPKLAAQYRNFDKNYPAPHPNEFKTGDEYERAMQHRNAVKERLAESLITCDKIANPDFYAEKKPESPPSDDGFADEVKSMAQHVPDIGQSVKILDSMSEYQKELVLSTPPGIRSLVAHCFGKSFTPKQIAEMDKPAFKANFQAALDFCYGQRAKAMAAQGTQTAPPAQTQSPEVKAPPRMSEAAPPVEPRKNFKEHIAEINKGFFRG